MRMEIVFMDGAYTDYVYDISNYYAEDGILWLRTPYGTNGYPLRNIRTVHVKADVLPKDLAPVDYMDV